MASTSPSSSLAPATFRIVFVLGLLGYAVLPLMDDIGPLASAWSTLPHDRVVTALRVSMDLHRVALLTHLGTVIAGALLALWQSQHEDAKTFVVAPIAAGLLAGVSGLVSTLVVAAPSNDVTRALLAAFENDPLLHHLSTQFGTLEPVEFALATAAFVLMAILGVRLQGAAAAAAEAEVLARGQRPANWR